MMFICIFSARRTRQLGWTSRPWQRSTWSFVRAASISWRSSFPRPRGSCRWSHTGSGSSRTAPRRRGWKRSLWAEKRWLRKPSPGAKWPVRRLWTTLLSANNFCFLNSAGGWGRRGACVHCTLYSTCHYCDYLKIRSQIKCDTGTVLTWKYIIRTVQVAEVEGEHVFKQFYYCDGLKIRSQIECDFGTNVKIYYQNRNSAGGWGRRRVCI